MIRLRLAFLVGVLVGAAVSVSVQGYTNVNTKPLRYISVENSIDEYPADFEHVGSEPEYIHGDHCMDGRVF